MNIINGIFTVDADLLMPILQWTRTFEPAFLNKKSKKRLTDDWTDIFILWISASRALYVAQKHWFNMQ